MYWRSQFEILIVWDCLNEFGDSSSCALVPDVHISSAACIDTSMSPSEIVYARTHTQIRDKCADQDYATYFSATHTQT